jgi:deoxyribose-phosphate aldolase
MTTLHNASFRELVNLIENDVTQITHIIDHTLLKPAATTEQIAQLSREGLRYRFASLCVNPTRIKLVADLVRNSDVKICTVIGFPLGATTTEVKIFEAEQALKYGVAEVDMVINIGALQDGLDELVKTDIARVSQVVHNNGGLCKVIIETALLSQDEKVRACLLARAAGADFVKTSTGFSISGATEEDIALMRQTVGPNMGVKASGGIRNLATARRMIRAGATRIGTGAGVQIVEEINAELPVSLHSV